MAVNTISNRYQLDRHIGSGGMGNVYRGIDQQRQTPIAVKILKPEVATAEMIARFVREGETLRQLHHPHIVTVLDAIQENGDYYLIMELVEGGSLADHLEKVGRLPLKQALEIALDLADALARAHRLDIIHRDIKPANVLLAEDGTPRLTDFGIARVSNSKITETGTVVGTTAYIAPEVLRGQPVDSRADIWSFGILLYEMLTGVRPFRADNPGTLIYEIIAEPLPDIEQQYPDLPAAIIDLLYRILAKNPAERIPSMRLVGAELEAILRGEVFTTTPVRLTLPASDDDLTARFATPSPAQTNAIPHNLPAQSAAFVGREAELSEIQKLLHDPAIRLVSILAPGGMGKTRLSLEAAAQFIKPASRTSHLPAFEHGVYFVDLAPLTSAENILPTLAEVVGYPFQQNGRSPKEQILNFLREKNSLLLMDNFEHVTEGRALVSDILQAAPGIKMLVTSREKLNLSSETVFALSGMDFPDWETPAEALEYSAVKLFMQSARRVRPDFELQAGDLTHVARICRHIHGMPLGILLAASWLELLSIKEVTEEIARSLDFLETEMHDVPERHRSVRSVFEYSWNLLPENERQLFAQLAIFRGGFTREAAQAITGASLRSLGTLVNKSLLRRDVISGRYEVHELLRQYAEEKLGAYISATRNAHSAYYCDLLHQQTPRLKGQGQLEALNIIEADFENIRAAWLWAVEQRHVEPVQQAMMGLYLFLMYRNRNTEGEQLFRAARQVWSAEGANPPLIAGQVLVRYPDAPMLPNFRKGLAIARQYGDLPEIAFCERLTGHWLSHTEFNQEEGVPLLESSLANYQQIGETFCSAQVLDDLGWSYNLMMEAQRHLAVAHESLALRRQIDDKIGMANSLRNLGGASGGFYDQTGTALKYWQEAKLITYEMNDRLGIAWNASLQGATYLFNGDYHQATLALDEAEPHARDLNDRIVMGFITIMRGIYAALAEGDYDTGERLIIEGFPPDLPPDFRIMMATMGASITAFGTGNLALARQYLRKLVQMGHFMSDMFIFLFMPLAALVHAQEGTKEHAAELLGGFFSVYNPIPKFKEYPLPNKWARDWRLLNDLSAQLKADLGAEVFEAAWERGKSLNPDTLREELHAMFLTPEG